MKRFLSKFVPEVPILVAMALLVTMPSLRGAAKGLATVFPFTVVAAAVLLGWRFNRSRLVFAIALLALAEYVLLNGLDTRATDSTSTPSHSCSRSTSRSSPCCPSAAP